MAWMPIPTVIEKTGRGEIARSLFDRLLDDRIIFIGTPIDDGIANLVIGQLLYLQKENRTQDINLYINSPGGSVTAGLAIYDVMQFIQPEVATYCVGQAASMGAVLLAAGAEGKRYSLPHSRIMIHQPSGGTGGTAADIHIQAQEILRLKDTLNRILAHHCKRDVKLISEESDRDHFMSPGEAKEYGLIDDVITTSKGLGGEAAKK